MTVSLPKGDVEFSIRRTERADLLAVMRIENESFPQPWPYGAFEQFLEEPGFLVATSPDGSIVGFVVADCSIRHSRTIGHIKDIAVHPNYRNQQIGSTLLSRALSIFAADGVDTVRLEVRESNHDAQRLYESFGFETLHTITGYYADGETAIVMVRQLE